MSSGLSPDRTLWAISAARMKNNRLHDVYLTPAARDVLASVPRFKHKGKDVAFVFTTTLRSPISGYSGAKRQLDEAIVRARAEAAAKAGTKPDPLVPWRLHDVRRTGVSMLAGMGFDSIVADKLLAHKPAKLKGVASVYQRHDFAAERRKALEAWSNYVTGAATGDNVVQLRAG
jgi:integrase